MSSFFPIKPALSDALEVYERVNAVEKALATYNRQAGHLVSLSFVQVAIHN